MARFHKPISEEFKAEVIELSKKLNFEPYTIDSITLTRNNGVFKKRKEIKTWRLD